MNRPTIEDVQQEIDNLSDEAEDGYDPRWCYDLSKESAYRSWPCAGVFSDGSQCLTRRDEHADQIEGRFPELDITDHLFIPAKDTA